MTLTTRTAEYTDEDRARGLAVLRANAGNMLKTSRETGYPRSTLRAWAGLREREGKRAANLPTPVLQDAVADLARKWLETAHRSVDLASRLLVEAERGGVKQVAAAARASKDLLISAAVATEKHQLLVGGATSRSESLHVSLIAADVLRGDTLQVIECAPGESASSSAPRVTGRVHELHR